VEVRCGEHILIFDGGSGLRDLGGALSRETHNKLHLFLSHSHFDHICGLPFFAPFFTPGLDVEVWAGHLQNGMTTHGMLETFMTPPFFPVTPSVFKARLRFRDFRAGDTLNPADGVVVRTIALNHPQGSTGYLVAHGGRSICYLTDTEAGAAWDQRYVDFARGADVLIVDAMFTDEELALCVGWGHSSWRQAVELAERAKVGTLVLFHHHPMHDDEAMDAILAQAKALRPGTLAAHEHLTLDLGARAHRTQTAGA
jgi:phosphoribosyl 1,2-cyclic phosphodiesterase